MGFGSQPRGGKPAGRSQPAKRVNKSAESRKTNKYLTIPSVLFTAEERLGLALRMIRRRKKLTIDEFAEYCDCSRESIVAFEAGLLSHDEIGSLLPKIALCLGVDPNALKNELGKIME
jgi:DNA-binding XRE family transcriptional regulator